MTENTTDYGVIVALIHELPKEGGWSKPQRDRWLAAMTAAIDLMIPVDTTETWRRNISDVPQKQCTDRGAHKGHLWNGQYCHGHAFDYT